MHWLGQPLHEGSWQNFPPELRRMLVQLITSTLPLYSLRNKSSYLLRRFLLFTEPSGSTEGPLRVASVRCERSRTSFAKPERRSVGASNITNIMVPYSQHRLVSSQVYLLLSYTALSFEAFEREWTDRYWAPLNSVLAGLRFVRFYSARIEEDTPFHNTL